MLEEATKITEEHYKIAEQNGISRANVRNRVHNLIEPWSIERAITEPVKNKKGKDPEWLKIAHENGIYTQLFHARKKRGWSSEKAATWPVQRRIARIRKEVQQFAELMNQRLEDNAHKDEVGWSDWEINDLTLKIQRNIRDIHMTDSEKEIRNHAADIGNYAMMIADNHKEVEE